MEMVSMGFPFKEKPMKKLFVTLGQDLSAYATIKLSADTDLSEENLSRIAQEAVDNGDVVFDADWETVCALRVVSVDDGKETHFVEDLCVECSPYDAGQVLQSFLNGHVQGLGTVVEAAAKAKLIAPQQMMAYTGYLMLPGAEHIQIDFECRKGATKEEADLAFIQMLAQIATVDYVAIGDASYNQ
jgi:hypothetical protein